MIIQTDGTFGGQTTEWTMIKYRFRKAIKDLGTVGVIAYLLSFVPILYYIFGIKDHTFDRVLDDLFGLGDHFIATLFAMLGIIVNSICFLMIANEEQFHEEETWCRACRNQTERFLHSYGNCGAPIKIGDKYYTDRRELRMMSKYDRIETAEKDFEIFAEYILKTSTETLREIDGDKYVEEPEIRLKWDCISSSSFEIKCPDYPW